MGCVHTHQKILAIKGWDSLSHIWNAMKKIGEDNQKAKKISQIVNQVIPLNQNMIKFEHNGL